MEKIVRDSRTGPKKALDRSHHYHHHLRVPSSSSEHDFRCVSQQPVAQAGRCTNTMNRYARYKRARRRYTAGSHAVPVAWRNQWCNRFRLCKCNFWNRTECVYCGRVCIFESTSSGRFGARFSNGNSDIFTYNVLLPSPSYHQFSNPKFYPNQRW